MERDAARTGGEATETAPFAGLAETHTAVVLFLGDRAYKVKKPVSLGFVDFRTRVARQAACAREVDLNRRLAPDVYLGVDDVVDADGRLVDHLVVMRRLPDATRLSRLARAGAPLRHEMRRLARLLAAFHARAERSAAVEAAASPEATLARWQANAARLAALGPGGGALGRSERILGLATTYLAGRSDLLQARIAAGRACDGHGDLQADDIFLLEDGPRVLDCLEFDDALRFGDVLADVAFLAMDLERLGRPELAAALLEDYARFSGDTWPASLAHLHVAYRAQVRALVAAVRAEQGDPDAPDRLEARLRLALAHLEAGEVRLLLVGGRPGTGKSSLAEGLATALDAVVLRSDELRKQRLGLDTTTSAAAALGAGAYAPEVTAATYSALLEHARTALSFGLSVVLDATFADPAFRRAARELAERTHARLTEVVCSLPRGPAARRLAARSAAGGDASDATAELAERLPEPAPWPEAVVVDTSGSRDDSLRQALEALGRLDGPGALGPHAGPDRAVRDALGDGGAPVRSRA